MKHLETSTKRIISRTWKDEKDRAELKQNLMQMAQYIHALQNSLLPLSQSSIPFSSKSPGNQKFFDEVQRNKIIAEIFSEWLTSIVDQGTNYISDLVQIFKDANEVTKELDVELISWHKEKTKWAVISKQMCDIQRYGLMNFLAERQVPGLNEDIMFICKESIEWHNQIIEQGHSKYASLRGELTTLRTTMQKDLRYVDVQLLKEDSQTLEDTTEMINQFSSHIKQIKVEKSIVVEDFTNISKVESMLTVCLDHLDSYRDKYKW